MNAIHGMLALSLTLLVGSLALPAQANGNRHGPPPARIVGLWQARVSVAPCQGGPAQSFVALNTFHAGGTMSDINAAAPTSRASGQGIWAYKGNGTYQTRFQFFRFAPGGAFDGVQDIRTTMRLDPQADTFEAAVEASVLNLDGSVRVQLCGVAIGERVAL